MNGTQAGARFDWLVDLGGALALALAAGFACLKLAPSLGFAPVAAAMASGALGFALGALVMRLVRPAPGHHRLAEFSAPPVETAVDDAFLLTEMLDDALLLDDPLVEAEPDSRVVQLFANPPMPTPGQLKARIDRHLAELPRQSGEIVDMPRADASGALYAALDQLRLSLR